jgi:hypothetical protein
MDESRSGRLQRGDSTTVTLPDQAMPVVLEPVALEPEETLRPRDVEAVPAHDESVG